MLVHGVWSVADVERLALSGLGGKVSRVLVEPADVAAADAAGVVAANHEALDEAGIAAPRLQHGDGESAWPLIRDALERGIDTRVGLEDVTRMPGGEIAAGNAALVEAVAELANGRM
jgi:beta-keto acid cleavage enzyme